MRPGDHPDFFRLPAPEGRSRESTLRLDREGRFLHEGELVTHRGMARAFASWIARHPDDGRFILTNGYDWTYFTVEGTPYFVEGVRAGEDGPVLVLFDGSEEAPDIPGFGLLPGRCAAITGDVKVPHVGWNTLDRTPQAHPPRVLDGIPTGAFAYFTHSYAAPVVGASIATTTHGVRFTAAIEHDRVVGVQFHPEKSGRAGLRLLTNFIAMARERA